MFLPADKVPAYARKALDIIVRAGFDARFAGGCVRDTLLGVEPKDWDVATDATPDVVTEIFKANEIVVIPTGIDHGTVSVLIDKNVVEITTLRKDVETNGRHAEVEFISDWKVDAQRRDFTMNALYSDHNNVIHDYVGGVQDLFRGKITFVGDAETRIEEDALRMLRALRFALTMKRNENGSVNLFLDDSDLKQIEDNSDLIKPVSSERVWSELKKALIGFSEVIRVRLSDSNVRPVSQRGDGFTSAGYYADIFRVLSKLISYSTGITFYPRQAENHLKTIATDWYRLEETYNLVNFTEKRSDILLLALMMKHGIAPHEFVPGVFGKMASKLKMSAKERSALIMFEKLFELDLIKDDFNQVVQTTLYNASNLFEAKILLNLHDDMAYEFPEDVVPFEVKAKDMMDIGLVGRDISAGLQTLRRAWAESSGKKTTRQLIGEFLKGRG